MTITGRVDITAQKSTNYLILGWWSNTTSYKLSDAGVPVVKVPDGTQLGYSVYALTAESSTVGASPAGSGSSQWKLIESAEFIYMQEAYIERLQAALVTAEKIESLMIRTKNLEVLDGAKVGGLKISGNSLTNEGFDNDAIVVLRNDIEGRFVGIGQVEPSTSGGSHTLGRFEINRTVSAVDNTALRVSAKGASGGGNNTAISITAGNISGLAMRARRVSSGTTLTRADVFLIVYAASVVTVYLPANPEIGEIKYIYAVNSPSLWVNGNGNQFLQKNSTAADNYLITTENRAFLWDGQNWIVIAI